jgi:cytochrome c553
MKRIAAITGLLALLSAVESVAEPSTRVAWTPKTLNFVKGGDAESGKTKAATCQGCHATDGANAGSTFPNLDGQLATYLYRQLQDYKNGGRPNPVMSGIAASLGDQDMADIAQWYSRQPVAAPEPGSQGEVPKLVSDGDSKRLIAPCGICHGGSGQGEPVDTPRLSGQKSVYLRDTLLAYKSGQRHNDLYSRMRIMAQRLSPAEIDALASYYGHLR